MQEGPSLNLETSKWDINRSFENLQMRFYKISDQYVKYKIVMNCHECELEKTEIKWFI